MKFFSGKLDRKLLEKLNQLIFFGLLVLIIWRHSHKIKNPGREENISSSIKWIKVFCFLSLFIKDYLYPMLILFSIILTWSFFFINICKSFSLTIISYRESILGPLLCVFFFMIMSLDIIIIIIKHLTWKDWVYWIHNEMYITFR